MRKASLAILSVALFMGLGWALWHNSETVEEFMHPTTRYAIWSFLIGALVTISLPLGALTGLAFKPGAKTTATLTAFGGGALLAALSVELIAPTVEEIIGHMTSPTHMAQDKNHAIQAMAALVLGCLLGGFLFYSLDELINSKGGFLRKIGTSVNQILQKNPDDDVRV